ncbi:MAG: oligosaccharide flippase family protein [Leptospirillia bacterium]
MLIQRLRANSGDLLWVTAGQGLAFVGALVGIKLLTHLLGPEGYGRLALALTISGAFNLLIYGPLGQGVLRHYTIYHEQRTLGRYLAILSRIHQGALSIVLVTGGAILFLVPKGSESGWWGVVGLAVGLTVVTGWYTSFNAFRLAMKARRVVAIHQAGDAWLRTLIAVAAVALLWHAPEAALAGYLLGTTVVVFSHLLLARRNPELAGMIKDRRTAVPTPEDYRSFLRYAGGFTLLAVPAILSTYADRWVLQSLFGEYEVGLYAALLQIAVAPITLMISVLNQFLLPVIYQKAGDMTSPEQDRESYRVLCIAILGFGTACLPVVLSCFAFGPRIVTFFTTVEFARHADVLWVLTAATALFWVGQLLAMRAECHRQPGMIFVPKLIHGVLFVTLALVMAPTYGINGVAMAYAAASTVYIGAILITNRQLVRQLHRT